MEKVNISRRNFNQDIENCSMKANFKLKMFIYDDNCTLNVILCQYILQVTMATGGKDDITTRGQAVLNLCQLLRNIFSLKPSLL